MSVVMMNHRWLESFQKNQLERFVKRGLPTRKEESWKYTDVSILNDWIPRTSRGTTTVSEHGKTGEENNLRRAAACPRDPVIAFINGHFCAELSNLKNLPETITLIPLSQTLDSELVKKHFSHEFDVKQHPFAVLNSAQAHDGVFLHVPKNIVLTTPIKIIFYNSNKNTMTAIRNIFILEEGSEVSIVEEYTSEAKTTFTNTLLDVHAHSNTKINYYKIQEEAGFHLGNVFVNQKQDSQVNLFNLSQNSLLAREDVTINLSSTGSECNLLGLYLLNQNNQHIDNHLHVDHSAQHGASSMLYKGILNNRSQAVFNGKVHVHKNAQGINAYQANHNLLLSKEAEVNTKPELEIYADDVKCAHGATIGQLDKDSLFYLCARGIAKEEAVKILLSAFTYEVISKIKNSDVRKYIQERVNAYAQ